MRAYVNPQVHWANLAATFATRARRLNLDTADVFILFTVGGWLAGTAQDILRLEVLSRQEVYRHVAYLTKLNYLRTERSTEDKRRVQLFLTPAGHRAAVRLIDSFKVLIK